MNNSLNQTEYGVQVNQEMYKSCLILNLLNIQDISSRINILSHS